MPEYTRLRRVSLFRYYVTCLFLLAVWISATMALTLPSNVFETHIQQHEMLLPHDEYPIDDVISRDDTLWNRCSRGHVQLVGHRVNAMAKKHSTFAKLRITSLSFNSRIHIQSAESLSYLCYNKTGHLKVKRSPGRDRLCEFYEAFTADRFFTTFRSAANPSWLLGFKPNGRPLIAGLEAPEEVVPAGKKPTQNSEQFKYCNRFTKRNFHEQLADTSAPRYGHGIDRRYEWPHLIRHSSSTSNERKDDDT